MIQTDSVNSTLSVASRVIKTDLVNWREFRFIQADNFKDLDPSAAHKLKASILSNQFTQPFYVWEDPDGAIYCLDGKHRTLMLEQLLAEGHQIPYLLPGTFIYCESKKEAAKLVTIYSSIYARVSQQGLFDFIKEYELEMSELKEQMDLPDFSMSRFEQKFDTFEVKSLDQDDPVPDPEEDERIIVKEGDIFHLGEHTLIVSSFNSPEAAEYFAKEKARIVLTDPPYNLPTDFFLVTERHEDFVEAAGEMTDEEFIDFLAEVMHLGCKYTVDGAIHYVFMDWRHVWHMSSAAALIYGSPVPKQLVVWAKDLMAMGSFYRSKHELCFVFKNGTAAHVSNIDLKDRIRTNVWNYPSGLSTANPDRGLMKEHPTPKPVQMFADAVLDTTNEKDLVIDFFLGTGTTLIACERTNRRCIGTEKKPEYAQLIINRYIQFCKKNGNPPSFLHVNGELTINDFDYVGN